MDLQVVQPGPAVLARLAAVGRSEPRQVAVPLPALVAAKTGLVVKVRSGVACSAAPAEAAPDFGSLSLATHLTMRRAARERKRNAKTQFSWYCLRCVPRLPPKTAPGSPP